MQPLIIHTHFYQPERANPWTGTLDPEPSAAPFRNWNERIHRECYRANAFARILDDQGRVERIVNTFERLSFNLGPTLLAWLERHHPATYARIIDADRRAVARTGHGNALAQAFHHTILPLDAERDRRTQIRWGIADFRHRFGREPEGMWLPETAASQAVVDALIDEGLTFTVLAPRQAARVRDDGGQWRATGGDPDTTRPYRIAHSDGSGRHLAAFFYDGGLAQQLAFDPKAMDSSAMLGALVDRARSGLLHAALDGETFGHHHRFGDLGLAYTLSEAAPRHGLQPTSYGAYLALSPPQAEAELLGGEGSSWSCAHGVGRWSRDCGCATLSEEGWNQQWRAPLRAALDVVREAAAEAFAERGAELLRDPWAARDAYARVLVGAQNPAGFLAEQRVPGLSEQRHPDVWALLESQRNAMAMYTSCGWFFADVSGIETVYVMRFAARALELLEELGVKPPRDEVLDRLAEARSNRPGVGNGADVWRHRVEPSAVTPSRVAAQVALRSAAGLRGEDGADGHDVEADLRTERRGRATLVTGSARVVPRATGRAASFAVAGLSLGGLDLHARAARATDEARESLGALPREALELPAAEILRELERRVGGAAATLDDLLPCAREELVAEARADTLRRLRRELAAALDRHDRDLALLRAAGVPAPPELRALDEARAADEAERLADELPSRPEALDERLETLAAARRRGIDVPLGALRQAMTSALEAAVARSVADPVPERVAVVERLVDGAGELGLHLDAPAAQEAVYEALVAMPAELAVADAAGLQRLGELLGLSPRLWETRGG